MIVEFSVKNFRSINDLQTLSFVATGLKSPEKYAAIDENNIVEQDGMKLFKTLGIYGANASGKSNVVKALFHFIEAIRDEPSSQSNLVVLFQPFLHQGASDSFFQIVFIIDNVKYRYGFTVKWNNKPQNGDINFSEHIVTNEWLYGKKDKNMRLMFKRSSNKIDNKISDSDKIPASVPYDHSLIISYAAALNNGICRKVKNYLKHTFSDSVVKLEEFRTFSVECIRGKLKGVNKKDFLELLSVFNIDYNDIKITEESSSDKIYPMNKIILEKTNFHSNSNNQFLLGFNESAGTKKLFDLAGLLLYVFNISKISSILLLDEIDSNFHPSLVIKLVNLFNDPKINKSNAQLLFTSHDTNLMSPSIMRRDQFYFTEKNEDHSTRLYSLADLKGIKNDANFARQYLAGYYGAVPVLKDYVAPEIVKND